MECYYTADAISSMIWMSTWICVLIKDLLFWQIISITFSVKLIRLLFLLMLPLWRGCYSRELIVVCVNCIRQSNSGLLHVCTLYWRHSGRDGVSDHRRLDCLLNPLFRRRSKKTSKLRVTGLCGGNSPSDAKLQRLHHWSLGMDK